MMRFLLSLILVSALTGCVSAPKPNQLSRSEQRAGWRLLFNGKNLEGWRSYRKPEPPKGGWVVENGILHLLPGSKAGDIVTREKFENFDLTWEWRLAPKANNGLKYLVREDRSAPGPEYQMIDDAIQPDPKHQTASFYFVVAPAPDKPLNPPGKWNRSRVLVQGNHVEHWLNGRKVLSYQFGSPALQKAIAESKFKNEPTFGVKAPGHIMLTDHNDEVWYRNVKIRELPVR